MHLMYDPKIIARKAKRMGPENSTNRSVSVRRIRWNSNVRAWTFAHKWSSLVCTAFLFVICLTGLPLLFSDEIRSWLTPHVYEALPPNTPMANLDDIATTGQHMYPGQIVTSIFVDDDEPQIYLWMAPSWEAVSANPKVRHFIRFDARNAKILERSDPLSRKPVAFLDVMFSLHRDLFLGLPGELFLGLMALLFIIATVSGVVLYGPFMRRLSFGSVRRGSSVRTSWLDVHNLLGATTAAWVLLVGATGLMNELSTPLFGIWKLTEVRAILAQWNGQPSPPVSVLNSVQDAFDTVKAHVPGKTLTSIIYPGSENGSPHHYVVWAKGSTPLTSRLFSPVLVDAVSGDLVCVLNMPWYLRALEVSRPLHFGDYGGLPLKILWALMDLAAIAILGSGLYLWFSKRRMPAGTAVAVNEIATPAGFRGSFK